MIYINQKVDLDLPPDTIELAAQTTLDLSNSSDSDITIVLTCDEEIQRLNLEYLKNDKATDVLSFPANEIDPETGRLYLGDVIISLPRASEQAIRRGHSIAVELQLLVIHGTLHILGLDHANPEEKSIMWGAQAEIMGKLGSAIFPFDEPEH